MLEIFLYAFGIMYTPGPANMLALMAGVNRQGGRGAMYCLGVAMAMLILLLFIGYVGVALIPQGYQEVIGIVGGGYIAYLGYKIFRSSLLQKTVKKQPLNSDLGFKTGFILQLFNPKALVVIVPIVTVQYPAVGIQGQQIAIASVLLSILAFGAPGCYLLMGSFLKGIALNHKAMAWINRSMALLLWYVAADFILPSLIRLF